VLAPGCSVLRLRRGEPLESVWGWRLPAFSDDQSLDTLRTALERTQPVYQRGSDQRRAAAARLLLDILASTPDPDARRAAIARAFRVLRVRKPLLMTAYYEPELPAARAPAGTFRYPLYARPTDLVEADPGALDAACRCRHISGRLDGGRLAAYPTRGEIDAGALAGHGLELAWTDDPISLFVLHVQGSGLLRFPDGTRIGARFAGTNGRPFRSLANILIARGLLERNHTSLASIRRVLESLPESERQALMADNQRFVFFKLADGGPRGSLGVELTPGRSVATDPRLVPMGALGYVVTPTARRFVVSQDTGAAIIGAHADLFLGAGEEAAQVAGHTRDTGTMYVLEPR
jgi:membrane-bound lytic murein transglycosylase A